MATERPPLPDDDDRAQAVRTRARNMLVDAGAGTGKTTLVIDEDTDDLVRAVFDRLLHGATTGQLGELLGSRPPGPVPLGEVEETVRLFVAAGLRTETRYGDDWILAGLDLLVAGMIDTRDVGYVPARVEPDLAAVRTLAADVAAPLKGVPGSPSGGRFLGDAAAGCREVPAAASP